MDTWIVFVGSRGVVYEGTDEQTALDVYSTFVYGDMAKSREIFNGVVLFKNDEPIQEAYGTMEHRYGLSGVIS